MFLGSGLTILDEWIAFESFKACWHYAKEQMIGIG